jgi:hypothetical protein
VYTASYRTHPHSLLSLSDDPSHNVDLDLTWRTSRQTEDSTASLFSYTSSSDDEDSSAANSSIARSDDGSSVEFDMAIDLTSPPPRHSRDRSSVQTHLRLSLVFTLQAHRRRSFPFLDETAFNAPQSAHANPTVLAASNVIPVVVPTTRTL